MTIRVTAEDIQQGECGSFLHCPVARAMSRALSKPVCVFGGVWGRNSIDVKPLPPKAKVFIRKFDMRQPVKPFSFTIKSP